MTDSRRQTGADTLATSEGRGASAALSNERLARAALVVMIAFVASGVLGLVRLVVIGMIYGAGAELDSFNAATRIPELLFNLIAGGALGSAFIPVFAAFLVRSDREGAWRLAGAIAALLAAISIVLAVAMYVAAPVVVATLLRPGDPLADQALTVDLLRIMLSTVVIFSLSGLLMGILNAHQHFWRPAFAMSLYNIGIIAGAVFLAPIMGIYGLAWGTVLGALLHLGIQAPGLRQIGAQWFPSLRIRTPGVLEVFRLMIPRIFGQAVVQVNFILITALTSFMVDGAQTAVNTAFALMFFVLGVIGRGLGTAVFPSLSTLAAQTDWPGYRRTLSTAVRGVLFLAIPATIGLIILALPLVAGLFERGRWTAEATAGTSLALQYFALGLVGHALLEILARSFYALHDTRTPVIVGVATMILNFALAVLLMHVIGQPDSLANGSFAGLALAMSLSTWVEAIVLWLLLRRRIGGIGGARVWALTWRALLAAAAMGAAVRVAQIALAGAPPLAALFASSAVGLAVYGGLAVALGLEEAAAVPRALFRRLRRS